MNLQQLVNTIVRAAIWRLMYRAPTWLLWLIVGSAFAVAAFHH
jgi:hypothetical protein